MDRERLLRLSPELADVHSHRRPSAFRCSTRLSLDQEVWVTPRGAAQSANGWREVQIVSVPPCGPPATRRQRTFEQLTAVRRRPRYRTEAIRVRLLTARLSPPKRG